MDTQTTVDSKPESNKIVWVVVAIIIAGIVFALTNVKTGDEKLSDLSSSSSTLATDGVIADEDLVVVSTADADQALPYTSALLKYGENRVVFDSACRPTRQTATFADGAKVMIDNRSSVAHRIVVADRAFDIGAYNFAFITFDRDEMPETFMVGCGENRTAMTVTLTK